MTDVQGKMEAIPMENVENVEELAQKRAEVSEKLQKREEERLAELQKRKEEKDSASAENESIDFFKLNFSRSRGEIERLLVAANDEAIAGKGRLVDHFDSLAVSVQKLQKFTTDTAVFLPSYEVQKAQEIINQLQRDIQAKRDVLIPKKKFAFKSKKKVVEADTDAGKPNNKVEALKREIKVDITDCNFADVTSEILVKRADETTNKDVALARLKDCTVKIFGSPRAIHVDRLTNCKVFTGPVSGSVFIDHCTNCIFFIGCQQLRVHHTTDTHFYIHVTSKAIIEDSHSVQFAPYSWNYEGIDEHYAVSGLDKSHNSWDDIDDFNWLASDAHSPNWRILEESERIKSSTILLEN